MTSVNISENLERIGKGIEEFKKKSEELEIKFSTLKEENIKKFNKQMEFETSEYERTQRNMKEEILRLEGCKMVYETLKDVYGDSIPPQTQLDGGADGHGGVSINEHPNPPQNEHHEHHEHENEHKDEDKPMALHELYKKYRAM